MIANAQTLNFWKNQKPVTSDQDSSTEPSLTLHFGDELEFYEEGAILDSRGDNSASLVTAAIRDDGYVLEPGDFILVTSKEEVSIPDNFLGYLVTRASLAKVGLQVHLCSPHVDPGTKLFVTFEVVNNGKNPVRIYPGLAAAKLFLFQIEN